MPGFFQNRPPLQLAGDIAIASLRGTVNGAFAGAGLSYYLAGGVALSTVSAFAGACALGAAISIIPAMALYSMLAEAQQKRTFGLTSSLLRVCENTLFRSAFAFTSGCIGAAILGYAIVPVATAALGASLFFGVVNLLSAVISHLTAPKLDNQTFLAAQIA